MNEIKKNKSEQISVMRFFALLFIIMAHVTFSGAPKWIEFFYSQIACIGVPTFFCISGYLFHKNADGTYFSFLSGKLKSVILPWIVCSSIVFFWLQYRRHLPFHLTEYVFFVLGYGSIYYFVPVLLVIMTVFFVNDSTKMCMTMIGLSVLSYVVTASNFMTFIGLESINYINFANWIGFFALGMLSRRGYFVTLTSKKGVFMGVIILFLAALVWSYASFETGYFSWVSPVFEIAGIVVVASLSQLKIFRQKIFFCIAKCSFCIYLLHQPIIGFFQNRFGDSTLIMCILPIIIAFGMTCFLYYFNWMICRMRLYKMRNVIYTLIGVRL